MKFGVIPPKKTAAGCKSYFDKVVFAIRDLKDHGGSSRQAIAKYLKATFAVENTVALRKALKKGVLVGSLKQDGQRFAVAGVDGVEAYEREPGSFVEIKDVKEGEGSPASAGDTVVVSYKGKLADGAQFDAAKSFSFTLGAGEVIKGWDEGVAGMKPGGKRKLVVPPKLGYGKKGEGRAGEKGSIPPDATLHFVVSLKRID